MSALGYAGVQFGFIQTMSLSSGPVPDPSGQDQLFTETNLAVRALIHPGGVTSVSGETPAQTADRITHLLTAPRRALVYTSGGAALLDVPAGDDDNGPWPDAKAFTIESVLDGSWVVNWSVRVRLTRCAGSLARPYLSVKWTETNGYDQNWLATRRRSGLLIVSSRGPAAPDDLRHLVTPAVAPGFARESAEYQLEESGLRLRFSFADRQTPNGLPAPLLDYEGHQAEIIMKPGVIRRGDFRLTVKGPPGVSKRDLLNAAIRMGMSRVFASEPQQNKNTGRVIIWGTIGEPLDPRTNAVSLHLQWNSKPLKARAAGVKGPSAIGAGILGSIGPFGGLAAGVGALGALVTDQAQTPEGRNQAAVPTIAAWLGQPWPGVDPTAGVAPPTRGLTPGWVGLAAAALNDPCGQTAELRGTGRDNYWAGTDGTGATVTASIVPVVSDDTDALDDADDTPGVWEEYEIAAHYTDDPGVLVEPASKPGTPCSKIRVHGGTLDVRYEWHLKRTGGAPTPPQLREVNDPNWVYVKGTCSPKPVDVAADGVSFTYEVSGVWDFRALDRTKAAVTYPNLPFLESSAIQQAMTQFTPVAVAADGTPVGYGAVFIAGITAAATGLPPVGP